MYHNCGSKTNTGTVDSTYDCKWFISSVYLFLRNYNMVTISVWAGSYQSWKVIRCIRPLIEFAFTRRLRRWRWRRVHIGRKLRFKERIVPFDKCLKYQPLHQFFQPNGKQTSSASGSTAEGHCMALSLAYTTSGPPASDLKLAAFSTLSSVVFWNS